MGNRADTGWLSAALLVAVVAGITVFAATSWTEYRRSISELQARADRTVLVVAEHMARAVETASLVTEHVAQLAAARELQYFAGQEGHTRLEEIATRATQVGSIWVMDAKGIVVGNSLEAFPTSVDFSDRPYYQPLSSGQDSFMTELLFGRVSRLWFFSYNQPIRDGSGAFKGIAQASMHAGEFHAFYEHLDLPPGSRVSVYRRDGRAVMQWPLKAGQMDPSHATAIEQEAFERPADARPDRRDDEALLTAVARTSVYPLDVSIQIPRSAATEPFWKSFYPRLAIVFGVLAIIGWLFATARLSLAKERTLTADRERAQAAQQVSEERFRHLADSVPQLVWMADRQGNVVYYNRRVDQYDGIEKTAQGWTWRPVVHPDDVERTMDAWHAAVRGEQPYECEHRVRMKDGSYRWHLSRATRVESRDEEASWFGTATDIHELKDTADALREREARYRALTQAVPSMPFEGDAVGNNTFASEQWCRYTGMTPEQTAGSGWAGAVHPDDAATSRARWLDAMKAGQPCEMRHRLRAADGSYRWFLVRSVPVRNAEGEIVRWVGSCTDIDAIVGAQAELLEADRKKNLFLATLAHELRNPLAPVRNAVRLLELQETLEPAVRDGVRMIDRQVTHLVRLVDDLLDVSRITSGKLELRREPCALQSVLEAALEASRPHIQRGEHRLSISLPARPVLVFGDPVRLTQVFANLLNNAAKYTPKAGTISVTVDEFGEDVVVRVADTGIGIPADKLPELFEMFSQAAPALDRSQNGLGIGLWLARRLAQLHGGSLDAQSEGEGRGTQFVVRLPVMQASRVERSLDGARPDALRRPSSRRRLLVIDDNQDAADSLAALLKATGNDVAVGYDGATAVRLAGEQPFDAIFLDIGLPDIDGYAVCRQIREMPGGRAPAIVAITGWGQEDDRRRSKEAGFSGHLVKPVDPALLDTQLALVGMTSSVEARS